jgi:peptide/nickel transport system permease protein
VIIAIVGAIWTPQQPTAFLYVPLQAPSAHAWLGADYLGRDVLSRVLAGGWVLLVMALAATVIGVGLGAFQGVEAAYLGGRTDTMIMRGMDVFLAFPQIVLALLIVGTVGPKLWLIVLAVGLGHVPQVARVMRAAALDISERDYVKAVELQGVKATRVITREILPNLVSPLMVELGLRLTYSIVVIAGLSFLGFGQQPPAPSWGLMIAENRIGLQSNPWAVIVPAALVALLAIGTNLFADAVARVAIGADRQVEQAFIRTETARAAQWASPIRDRSVWKSGVCRYAWRVPRPTSSRKSISWWRRVKCSVSSASRALARRRLPWHCSAILAGACT